MFTMEVLLPEAKPTRNIPCQHLPKRHRHRIPQLPHVLRPNTVEDELVRKRLNPGGLSDRQVSHSAVRKQNHILPARHAMISSLQSLRRFVKRRTGMANIRFGSGLEYMIRYVPGQPRLGVGQPMNRIPHGKPRCSRKPRLSKLARSERERS